MGARIRATAWLAVAARSSALAVCLAVVALYGAPFVAAAPTQSPYGVYVQDDAGVISEDVEQRLFERAKWLHRRTGTAQVGVVTVTADELGDRTIEEYAVARFRAMGLGGKDRNDGVLLLYTATEPPHVRIELGYGLEGRITDGKAGAILDQLFVPGMRDGNLNRAFEGTQSALVTEAAAEYGIDSTEIPGAGQSDFGGNAGYGGNGAADSGLAGWFASLPGYAKLGFGIGIVLLFVLDFKLTGGAITFGLLNLLGRRGSGGGWGGRGGGRGGFGGGGGSSGGGGASR